jgi:hypothetical protein
LCPLFFLWKFKEYATKYVTWRGALRIDRLVMGGMPIRRIRGHFHPATTFFSKST